MSVIPVEGYQNTHKTYNSPILFFPPPNADMLKKAGPVFSAVDGGIRRIQIRGMAHRLPPLHIHKLQTLQWVSLDMNQQFHWCRSIKGKKRGKPQNGRVESSTCHHHLIHSLPQPPCLYFSSFAQFHPLPALFHTPPLLPTSPTDLRLQQVVSSPVTCVGNLQPSHQHSSSMLLNKLLEHDRQLLFSNQHWQNTHSASRQTNRIELEKQGLGLSVQNGNLVGLLKKDIPLCWCHN